MNDAPLLPSRSLLRRLRNPLLILAFGGGAFAFFHLVLDTEKASHTIAMGKAFSILLTLLLLTFWLYFGSGLRKSRVAMGVLSVVAVFFGLFQVKPDGSMNIGFELRRPVAKLLGISHDDELNYQRQFQNPGVAKSVELIVRPGDWPEYRGPGRSGVYRGPALNMNWEANPPQKLWEHLIGNGYAGFAVANGHLVTIEQRLIRGEECEAVVCYAADTGLELWKCSWPGRFDEAMGGAGPRATPTIADGMIYALGATGRLVCIDGAGKEVWAVETLQGNNNLTWAMAGSPLVDGDLVFVTPGTQSQSSAGRSILALDRRTGKEVWATGSHQGSYSSPCRMTLLGIPQLVVFDGLGVGGYELKTGKELWRLPWTNGPRINVAQPLQVSDSRLLIASGYDTGATLLNLSRNGDTWQVEPVWKTKTSVMRAKFTTPVIHDNHIYGLNDGYLECVDLANGKQKWKDDRRRFKPGEAYGHGQLLLSGNHLIVLTEYGELVLVETNPEELREVGRIGVLEGRCWNTFAIVDGVIYLRNDRQMKAYRLQ